MTVGGARIVSHARFAISLKKLAPPVQDHETTAVRSARKALAKGRNNYTDWFVANAPHIVANAVRREQIRVFSHCFVVARKRLSQ